MANYYDPLSGHPMVSASKPKSELDIMVEYLRRQNEAPKQVEEPGSLWGEDLMNRLQEPSPSQPRMRETLPEQNI